MFERIITKDLSDTVSKRKKREINVSIGQEKDGMRRSKRRSVEKAISNCCQFIIIEPLFCFAFFLVFHIPYLVFHFPFSAFHPTTKQQYIFATRWIARLDRAWKFKKLKNSCALQLRFIDSVRLWSRNYIERSRTIRKICCTSLIRICILKILMKGKKNFERKCNNPNPITLSTYRLIDKCNKCNGRAANLFSSEYGKNFSREIEYFFVYIPTLY